MNIEIEEKIRNLINENNAQKIKHEQSLIEWKRKETLLHATHSALMLMIQYHTLSMFYSALNPNLYTGEKK